MPYITNFLIFTLAGQRSPWIIRWLAKMITEAMKKIVVIPNVVKASRMVSLSFLHPLSPALMFGSRLKMTYRNRKLVGSQEVMNLVLLIL